MPFTWHQGYELFNDCLYYRRVARDLIEQDERRNVFEIRRALRNSFVCLSMFWEYKLNQTVYGAITRRLFDIKQVERLEDQEIDKFDIFFKSNFRLKTDLLELLTGVNLKERPKC